MPSHAADPVPPRTRPAPGLASPDRRATRQTARQANRTDRQAIRRERRAIRRRLATPPPDYLSGPVTDGKPDGRQDGSAGDRRRIRVKLAVASMPLLAAIVLFTVSALGPADDQTGAPTGQADPAASSSASDTETAAPSAPQDTDSPRNSGALRDADSPPDNGASPVPEAPEGYRPLVLRVADPAALSVVGTDDRVDVIGMDGTVLANDVQVLQDRSDQDNSVVVVAVPTAEGPDVAAAALGREVTVLLAPTSS